MNKSNWAHVLTTSLWLGVSTAAYGAVLNPLEYDLNGNGVIDPGTESRAFLEATNKLLAISGATAQHTEVIASRLSTVQSEDSVAIASNEPKRNSSKHFYLRKSLDEVDLLEPIEDQIPGKGALFSFTHDFKSSNDKLLAQGALFATLVSTADPEDPRNLPSSSNAVDYSTGWLVGTSFNIVDDDKPGKLVDQLNFDIGYQTEVVGGPLFDYSTLRIWAHHKTDTEFKSTSESASLDWFPIRLGLINAPINNDKFTIQPKFLLHSEFNQVLDSGNKANLASQDQIFGVGGEIGVDFWIAGTADSEDNIAPPWMHGYIGYNAAWGELGGDDTFQGLLTAEADFFLGSSTNYSLTFKYQDGTIPYSGEELRLITAGLSVKM